MNANTAPKPPSPICWILNEGCFGIRAVPTKAIAASSRKVAAGQSEKNSSQPGPAIQFWNGRCHPPSHNVTAMDDTASMAAYSAKKNSDQRKPEYSVWKPATSSDSASGKSKGARLVSATMATANRKKASRPSGKNLKINQ